jgi:carboxypeptidase C (cathepsin A)
VQAPHPWTDVTNLLVLDIPLGSGWSYTDNEDRIANSSSWVAGEVDDALQVSDF